ncbi:hypothetical protein LSH36_420g02033 [Paralvinella palmiformis]|uniref:HAP1 N-terminal domain-containing protein n=1 Tax=Paralvinella palmiformis TaxID=53620 RepID=A0AAD9JD01_9ANNE|nr:hypothetical protein LSH36_420g02033 [Paralvinella palmiformis]
MYKKWDDLCHSKDLPEVDLVSLVEEQIPRYRLRADTITSFSGYKHDDFIKTPVLRPDVELDLSLELIEETLKYFKKSQWQQIDIGRGFVNIGQPADVLSKI